MILTLAYAVNALSVPYTMYFKAQKRGREIRNITLASQIVFLAANVGLIPLLGITGAAWSALLAFGLDFTLYLIAYKKAEREQ
jgi:O-antigen/teichoic acid export membrane protein